MSNVALAIIKHISTWVASEKLTYRTGLYDATKVGPINMSSSE